MATKKQSSDIEVFVLVDCPFGKAGEVVTLPQADADIGAMHGMLDLAPAAVKNAKGVSLNSI